jgi:hypothetical protein
LGVTLGSISFILFFPRMFGQWYSTHKCPF